MKRLRPILFVALLVLACAHLPEIREADQNTTHQRTAACLDIFPRGEWQFTHAIEIFPPGGSKQTLLGIVKMSSKARTFHCVMMTLEGFVLFEASYDGAITIHRAISPLDKPGVAEGMIRDILLIFFAPAQPCTSAGFSEDGAWICRYPSGGDESEDILLIPDGTWQIRRYSATHKLLRTVAPIARKDIQPDGPAARVELKAPGLAGYRLRMRLVEAVPLDQESKTIGP